MVIISKRILLIDRWEKDGQKHSRLSVVADRTQFLGGGNAPSNSNTSFSDSAPSTASAPTPAPVATPAPAPVEDVPVTDAPADDENLPF